ncbi:3'-5' exonuclease [Lactobacillus sp. DCY120]|uniref:DNA polymerase III polC-type n=1 Tax=Bombilactobacillus apium TaxID=2675299 RepID=A0A850R2D6_9LACO|nr:3'-5' exonuclease [Bombilactobacillus apium]NVY97083.1 3'-5' exonuclease [Bombilactobacillus apium]
MNFVAMDFETANQKASSACSLALALVENSRIVDTFYTLINPQTHFNSRNIAIHHINPRMVQTAPTFDLVWPHIKALFNEDHLVVAHNAPFDNRVLKETLAFYQLQAAPYWSLDTVRTSRKFYPEFPNHKLNTVAQALKIKLEHHHHALDDTLACAEILLTTQAQVGTEALKKMTRIIQ